MHIGDGGDPGYSFKLPSPSTTRESGSTILTLRLNLANWYANLEFATQTIKKEEKEEKKTLMGFKKHRVPYWFQLNLGGWKSITLQPSWVLKKIGFPSLGFPTVGPR